MSYYTGTNRKDALGNPIEMGKLYGASVDSNGITTVTVGEAVRFTPTNQVTLNVKLVRKGLWNDEPDVKEEHARTKTFKGMKLFPVNLV